MKNVDIRGNVMKMPQYENNLFVAELVAFLRDVKYEVGKIVKFVPSTIVIPFSVHTTEFIALIGNLHEDNLLMTLSTSYKIVKEVNIPNIIILHPVSSPGRKKVGSSLSSQRQHDHSLKDLQCKILILSDFWVQLIEEADLKAFLAELSLRITQGRSRIDWQTIVKLLNIFVKSLYKVLQTENTDTLVSEVVTKLELSSVTDEIKKKKAIRRQILYLSSYLFITQILFYQIFRTITHVDKNMKSLHPPLTVSSNIQELQAYFSRVSHTAFRTIYRIKLTKFFPSTTAILNRVNQIIDAIKLLRIHTFTHDLTGRLFNELIPFDVRKLLAAFYTHPMAAELVAALTIDNENDTVLDPACGTGTLLVSAYRRKKHLIHSKYGADFFESNKDEIHHQFVEYDLTGFDIMTFATYLATINLAMQQISVLPTMIRVANIDALNLFPVLSKKYAKKNGDECGQSSKESQHRNNPPLKPLISIKPTYSTKKDTFFLYPVDVILMNPPFTAKEKLPKKIQTQLNDYQHLTELSGKSVNYWGYFLVLAHFLIRPCGKIGAIIPLNLFRGKENKKLRDFLLTHYHITYIVKLAKEHAFSEGAQFKDIIVVAEKTKPKKESITTIVYIQKKKNELSFENTHELAQAIIEHHTHAPLNTVIRINLNLSPLSKKEERVSVVAELFNVPYSAFKNHPPMEFLWGGSLERAVLTLKFWENLKKKAQQRERILIQFPVERLREGFHTSPAGISQLVFITRPRFRTSTGIKSVSISKDPRTTRAFLILTEETREHIKFSIKKNPSLEFLIANKETHVLPCLRTATAVSSIDLGNFHDYLIIHPYNKWNIVLQLSKYKNKESQKFNWSKIQTEAENKRTLLLVPRRVGLYSVNTHLLAFYCDKPIVAHDSFKIFSSHSKTEAKYYSLLLNSVITILFYFSHSQESTGEYKDIKSDDWKEFLIPNYSLLTTEEKEQIVAFFDSIRDVSFPSLTEQFIQKNPIRVALDRLILELYGFSSEEVDKWLSILYDQIIIPSFKARI